MLRGAWRVPLVVFLVAWTLTMHAKYSASGDEPHYLMVTESLLRDHDLDLRDDYAQDRGARFGHDHLGAGPHARTERGGRLYPVHDIGVPILLLPAYAAGNALASMVPESLLRIARTGRGLLVYGVVSLFLIAVTSAAAALARAALIARGARPGIASTVVLALWLTPPVIGNAFGVYPEPFALLLTAWAVYAAADAVPMTRVRTLLLALALGVLPWIHRKYALYGGLLLLAVAVCRRRDLPRLGAATAIGALGLFLAPSVLLASWSRAHWGSVAGALVLERAPFSWAALRSGTLGLLVDRENGLLIWAPALLLLPAGAWLSGRRGVVWALPALALFLLSAAHDQWWGGFSPVGRFLLPLAPVVALAGPALARARGIRPALLALLLVQLVITALSWQEPKALWAMGDGHNRVIAPLLRALGASERILPSLRDDPPQRAFALALLALIAAANLLLARAARPRFGAGKPGSAEALESRPAKGLP